MPPDTTSTEPDVLLDVRDGIAIVTLNRPHRMNALRHDTLSELDRVLEQLERSTSVKVLLVQGAGRAFCSGADIGQIHGADDADSDAFTRAGQAVFERLESSPVVSVAALHGYALGGGLELAMACDLRLAATTCQLGHPEAGLGHLPAWGGTRRLARLVGRGKALELILTADRLTADQALTLGLVDHMVPDLELPSFALDFARELAHRPAAVVRAVKEAVLRGLADGSAAGHQAERTGMAICRRMPTSSETRQQFVNSSAT